MFQERTATIVTSSAAAGNKLNKRATSVDAGSGQGRGCSEITGSKQIRGQVGDRVQAGIKKKKKEETAAYQCRDMTGQFC